MVNSKSYFSTTAVDRIIELSWQPVNWILVKPGEGGGSEHKLEGYNTDNICQKWEMCRFQDRHRHWCALTGDILFAKKGDFIKHKQREKERFHVPHQCLELSNSNSPVNQRMHIIKPAFIPHCSSLSTCKHYISTRWVSVQVSFLFASPEPCLSLWRQPF